MEDSILNKLKSVNYDGAIQNKESFNKAVDIDGINDEFLQVIKWLIVHIKQRVNLQENFTGDKESFFVELKGVLRELECPYHEVMSTNKFDKKCKLFLLDFLLSELQASRMAPTTDSKDVIQDDPMDGSSTIASCLKLILQVLNIPPSNDTEQLFNSIDDKIKEVVNKLPRDTLSDPLLERSLDTQQWGKVSQINDMLCQEYKKRHQVLIKRLDVTAQSFTWSDKLKNQMDDVNKKYDPIRHKLKADTLTSIVDILAARKDLCIIGKTSSGEAREVTKCDINKTLIGKVPDRGGRPSLTAPPPEMPKFQQRRPDTGRGGGRGRGGYDGRGRGRGGYEGGGRGGRGGRGGYDRGNRGNYQQRGEKMYYS